MDPRLQTLLTNSASISKIVPDNQLLMQLVLNSLFYGQPTDAGSLAKVDPVGMMFLSPQENLAIEIYAIASKLGLPTDGQSLYNACFAASGPFLASQLPTKIQSAWFKNIGAF